jgi:flagella basal body P-ring formation protein FlgA
MNEPQDQPMKVTERLIAALITYGHFTRTFTRVLSIVKIRGNALLLWGLALAMLTLAPSARAERQSLASINLQAEAFIAAYPYDSPYPVKFQLTRLDPRLHLKPCDSPLQIGFTQNAKVMGNTSLSIECRAPVGWNITLPVQISVFQDVIVNKTPLIKGQGIDASRITFKKMDVSRMNQGYFFKLEQIEELQAKRNLRTGSVLDTGNVAAKQLVKSGQQVTILFTAGGISIKSTGQALHSARYGEAARVKNTGSNRVVEGLVTAPGQITVGY